MLMAWPRPCRITGRIIGDPVDCDFTLRAAINRGVPIRRAGWPSDRRVRFFAAHRCEPAEPVIVHEQGSEATVWVPTPEDLAATDWQTADGTAPSSITRLANIFDDPMFRR